MRGAGFLIFLLLPWCVWAKDTTKSDPKALELIEACRARLYSQSGRAVLSIQREVGGAKTKFQGVLLGKMEPGYFAVKFFIKKPLLLQGLGVVYVEDREEKKQEIYSFLPGQTSLTRLTAEGINKLVGSTGVNKEVLSGVSEIHTLTGKRACLGGECQVVRSGRSDGKGAYFETLIREDISVPVYAERRAEDGTLLWSYEVTELKQIDGVWTEISAILTEPGSKTTTRFTVEKIEWGIEFVGNFFTPDAFVDSGWSRIEKQ